MRACTPCGAVLLERSPHVYVRMAPVSVRCAPLHVVIREPFPGTVPSCAAPATATVWSGLPTPCLTRVCPCSACACVLWRVAQVRDMWRVLKTAVRHEGGGGVASLPASLAALHSAAAVAAAAAAATVVRAGTPVP